MGAESFLDIDSLIGPPVPADSVRETQLAELLGLSTRSIRELSQKSIILKSAPGRYPQADSVRRYCAHLREQAGARSGSTSLTAERIRVAREQADGLELKNAALRREMVPAKDVAATWAGILQQVRAAMLAIPSRVQQRIGTLTAADVDTIDREIRNSLEELASE